MSVGIGKIVGLWVANAHFARAGLRVEIYTCVQKTHKATDAVHCTILDSVVRRLAKDHGVSVTLFFKEDSTPPLTHDRYLETGSVAIHFSKGFDYGEADGTLHRCTAKIDNGIYDHLLDYRNLKDRKPPSS
jgi:hypothetical protein